MSSILTSQGVVFATAMAVSGTVILLAFRLQKLTQFSLPPISHRRSCISSGTDGKKRDKNKKNKNKNKKVHFADDVVDPAGNSEEFRRLHRISSYYGHANTSSSSSFSSSSSSSSPSSSPPPPSKSSALKTSGKVEGGMPANRAALYNGILRDRVLHRPTYAY